MELAIDFNPKFSGEIANYPAGDMIRIDIVVADCTPNYSNLDKLFSWGGNTNLSEAIRNTLQDLNLVGRPVYSYFVKLINKILNINIMHNSVISAYIIGVAVL